MPIRPNGSSGGRLKFGAEELIDRRGVCLALGLSHDLTDEPADRLRPGLDRFGLAGVVSNSPSSYCPLTLVKRGLMTL